MLVLKRMLSLGIAVAVLLAGIAAVIGLRAAEPSKKIRIIYTNDLRGNLVPCGCGGQKQGGLPRMSTAINDLIKENPNAVIVDSGNLTLTTDKLDIMLSIMSEMHYDAIGIGNTDPVNGKDDIYSQAGKHKIALLDANPGHREPSVPYIIKNVDGVKVGIISFSAPPPGQTVDNFEVRKAIYGAYKEARDASDVLIVLDQANVINADWLARNGKRFGAPNVVIGGVSRSGNAESEVVGDTYMVPTTTQGKSLGVADLEVSSDGIKVAAKRMMLVESIKEDEVVLKKINEFDSKKQVTPVKAEVQQTPVSSVPKTTGAASDAKPFYPSTLCKTCHVKEYDNWKATGHAKAINTLVDAKKLVPECLSCHSEMYKQTRRVSIPADGVGGVECATCHIDALPHGMERKAVAKKTIVNTTMCVSCHNKERSPNYDEQAYFPRIMHGNETAQQGTQTSSAATPGH